MAFSFFGKRKIDYKQQPSEIPIDVVTINDRVKVYKWATKDSIKDAIESSNNRQDLIESVEHGSNNTIERVSSNAQTSYVETHEHNKIKQEATNVQFYPKEIYDRTYIIEDKQSKADTAISPEEKDKTYTNTDKRTSAYRTKGNDSTRYKTEDTSNYQTEDKDRTYTISDKSDIVTNDANISYIIGNKSDKHESNKIEQEITNVQSYNQQGIIEPVEQDNDESQTNYVKIIDDNASNEDSEHYEHHPSVSFIDYCEKCLLKIGCSNILRYPFDPNIDLVCVYNDKIYAVLCVPPRLLRVSVDCVNKIAAGKDRIEADGAIILSTNDLSENALRVAAELKVLHKKFKFEKFLEG